MAARALPAALPGHAPAQDDDVPVTVPRGPARRAAEDELSDPAYHQDDPGLVRRVVDWLWEHLTELLDAAGDAAPGGAVGLAVIVLVVLLLLAALWARLGSPRTRRTAGDGGLFPERPRSAADHRAAAERHAADGHWSEAVQERMRALVRSLEERALLEPRPGRTADEAAAEAARALPGHEAGLRAAARAFDEVTYAGRPAGQDAYARLRALDEDVRRTRPRPAEHSAAGATTAVPPGGHR
ncbi:DUF4129 domain-containing protein [Streptomyces sp. JJ36]|uniref:DUF4129 domain-containing protein n=1 Tax=Streptomyces sp. JJ36 TaxID=2736645 RepID=UPI001F2773B2|nr:DUF4129 domain-containing protein [Streptomyces sp. JJ36]